MSKVYHTVTRVSYTDKHPRYIRNEDDYYVDAGYYEKVLGVDCYNRPNVLDAVVVNQFVTEYGEE